MLKGFFAGLLFAILLWAVFLPQRETSPECESLMARLHYYTQHTEEQGAAEKEGTGQ